MSASLSSALILIDVQESFRHRPYWSEADLPRFLLAANTLIEGCVQQGIPIVRVLHTDEDGQPAGNPFDVRSGHVRPLEGLAAFDAALTVEKHRHSALVGTGLRVWLTEQGIRRVIVAGIRTEQCCETTARHASDEGWQVDFVGEATLTFDMSTPGGDKLTAAQIVERTETVLAGRFATLCTVREALQRAR